MNTGRVERARNVPVRKGRNHCGVSPSIQDIDERIGFAAFVPDGTVGVITCHQVLGLTEIGALTGDEKACHGVALSIEAWTLVVNPPRERPKALSSVVLWLDFCGVGMRP